MIFSNELLQYLRAIYDEQGVCRIKGELEAFAQTLPTLQPWSKSKHWYKSMQLYAVYPDAIVYSNSLPPLQNLTRHLPLLKKLNYTAIHILPFLESPMIDKGFDICNFFKVRHELGTLADLIAFNKAADKARIYRFMDLVLNHVSEQHEWFTRAQAGDEYYRDYFIFEKKKPCFIRRFQQENNEVAEYQVQGEKILVHIPFPELVGPVPHWRQGTDGYWYYHTYYPQQLDLNWLNPNVFIELAKVLMYWASFGFNFRLDAIPFVGKTAYKIVDISHKTTHYIVAAMANIAQKINPSAVMLVETYEPVSVTIDYFGTAEQPQAHLAYNFHLCADSWMSLLKQDSSYIWQKLAVKKNIPPHAQWLNFLRNHDELAWAHLSASQTNEMRQALLGRGLDFKQGHGTSGRTFSFLGNNQQHFFMAYFLLASLPGSLMMPYGDEIAATNTPLNKLSKEESKDTRNINRGIFHSADYETEQAECLIRFFKELFNKRKKFQAFLQKWPEQLSAEANIFAASYKLRSRELRVYINLSPKEQSIQEDFTGFSAIAVINKIELFENTLILGTYGGVWLLKNC